MTSIDEGESGPFPGVRARFRYRPFLDFLADAAFQHRHAVNATNPYTANRFARAAVISAALSVESLANCLIADLDLPKEDFDEVDRKNPLDKIGQFFKHRKLQGFGKGDKPSQRCNELLRVRDLYVHPKTFAHRMEIAEPRDGGVEWIVPMSIELELWPILGIPKASFAWTSQASETALRTAFAFHEYVLKSVMQPGEAELQVLLASRSEYVSGGGFVLPLDDFMKKEFADGKAYGLRLAQLGLRKLTL